jgi:hypothetical protein
LERLLAGHFHHCLAIDRELRFLFSSLGCGFTVSFGLVFILIVVAVAIGLVTFVWIRPPPFHFLLLPVPFKLRRIHHLIPADWFCRLPAVSLFPLCRQKSTSGQGWTWRG